MKKLISLLTSITLCVGAMSALSANAGNIAVPMGMVVTRDDLSFVMVVPKRLEELGITDYYCHIDAEKDDTLRYLNHVDFRENNIVALNEASVAYDKFIISAEKSDDFLKYMADNYPEYTINASAYDDIVSMQITNYESHETEAENSEFFSKVCRDTGASPSISMNLHAGIIYNYKFLGDLSSDNALTPVDASMLLSYYADAQSGVAVASAENGADYSGLGGFNGDGVVTPTDASEILSYYADQQTAQV